MSMILFIDSLFVTFDKGKSIVSLLFFQIQPKKMLQLVVFRDKKEISLYVWSQWMWCKCMTNERTKMTLMLCSPQYYDMQACILICPQSTCHLSYMCTAPPPLHLTLILPQAGSSQRSKCSLWNKNYYAFNKNY